MNRGRRGEDIFSGSEDFAAFVALLKESAERMYFEDLDSSRFFSKKGDRFIFSPMLTILQRSLNPDWPLLFYMPYEPSRVVVETEL
jgi:hypothetical protein